MSLDDFRIPLLSHQDFLEFIGERARERRKHVGFSMEELSQRSGVSVPTIGRFEREGRATLDAMLKIARALDSLNDFALLFQKPKYSSIDEYVKENS